VRVFKRHSHHRLQNSAFGGPRRLGNLTIVPQDEYPDPNQVRYCTIHKFKGLEADCVLLTGVDTPNEHLSADAAKMFLYVGASRARMMLYVFRRVAG